jgi:hypothetical protein
MSTAPSAKAVDGGARSAAAFSARFLIIVPEPALA